MYLRSGKPHDNAKNWTKEIQVSSPKDNKVLFDFFDFFTEAEPPFWEFLDLSSELTFMTPSFNSSSWPLALRLLFDLILVLDEEEKESPWEAEDFEPAVGSFDDEDWVESSVALSAFGSGIGGRPFSITKYLSSWKVPRHQNPDDQTTLTDLSVSHSPLPFPLNVSQLSKLRPEVSHLHHLHPHFLDHL